MTGWAAALSTAVLMFAPLCVSSASAKETGGGALTTPFTYPWVAGVSIKGSNLFSCGGALVGEHWIVTSAKCNVEQGDSVHVYRHDMYDFAESDAEKLDVSTVYRHPTADLALVRFCEAAQTTVAQVAKREEEDVHKSLLVAGWGPVATSGNSKVSKVMHEAKAYAVEGADSGDGVVYVSRREGAFAWKVDAGTPLFDQEQRVVGVASVTQQSDDDCSKPAAYTQLAFYSEWMTRTMHTLDHSCEEEEGASARRMQQQSSSFGCGAATTCGECAGQQGNSDTFCYWCATSQVCYTEEQWLEDQMCPFFATDANECGAGMTGTTNTVSTYTQPEDKGGEEEVAKPNPCAAANQCGSCADRTYTDDVTGEEQRCYWCGRQQQCISTDMWENETPCNEIGFSKGDCPMEAAEDECVGATTCDACMSASFADFLGVYNKCMWCGDRCVAESRSGMCDNPQDVCMPPGGSAKTCRQLGWAVAPNSKSCGSSKIRDSCSSLLAYQVAKTWCEDAGARLCRSDEIATGVGLRTGCSLDDLPTWTSDTCIGGHYSASADNFLACDGSTFKHNTRCCADEPKGGTVPSPIPSKSCAELGWNTAPSHPMVCANSIFQGNQCMYDADFETAQAACWSMGARLCSAGELQADEAKNSGCKLDSREVWSSTACDNGVLAAMGSASPIEPSCEPLSSKRGVRCCADHDAEYIGLKHSCEDLGWPVMQAVGRCAQSKVGGQCSGSVTQADAAAFCSGAGARVCSSSELEMGLANNSGCKLDDERVWTSTLCKGGVYTMSGSGNNDVARVCTPLTDAYPVRCCTDSINPAVSMPYRAPGVNGKIMG